MVLKNLAKEADVEAGAAVSEGLALNEQAGYEQYVAERDSRKKVEKRRDENNSGGEDSRDVADRVRAKLGGTRTSQRFSAVPGADRTGWSPER